MKKVLIMFLMIGSLFWVTGCKDKDDNKIVLAEVTHSVFYAPQYLALSEGIFEDNGLEVELMLASGADLVMSTLLSGDAQIGLMGPEASIYVYEQGAKDYAINFAQLTQGDGAFIFGREDIKNFTLDNLKGHDILGGRQGGVPCMSLQYALAEFGIDWALNNTEAEVNVRTDIEFAAMAGSFIQGIGDFTTLFEPTASMLESQGKGFVLAPVSDFTPNIAYTCYSALSSYFDSNEEQLIAFTKSIQEAQDLIFSLSNEEVATKIESFFEGTEHDILVSSIKRYREANVWASTPELTIDELNTLMDIMINAGELDSYAPFGAIVDNSIFNKIK